MDAGMRILLKVERCLEENCQEYDVCKTFSEMSNEEAVWYTVRMLGVLTKFFRFCRSEMEKSS